MRSIIIASLIVSSPVFIAAEKPIVPVPPITDISLSLSILKYSEGFELLQKTTHFNQTLLHFLRLISNEKERTTNPLAWVHECKQTYSLLNTLHHQANIWLTHLAILPQKGITPSPQEWHEISALGKEVEQQRLFLSSTKMKRYMLLIAQTESQLLTSMREPFITKRIRTYTPPPRW
jgi:hypothetical protein